MDKPDDIFQKWIIERELASKDQTAAKKKVIMLEVKLQYNINRRNS
jgi:hypothetical protein